MTMKLNYPTQPEPGTIIDHIKTETDVKQRFRAIELDGTVRTAHYLKEVYPLAMGGYEPRSIVEHYIVRRKWTPYGYAKVWGYTPECAPPVVRPSPVPRTPEEKPRTKKQIMEDVYRGQARCKAWYDERRPPEVIKDWSWLREGKKLYAKAHR